MTEDRTQAGDYLLGELDDQDRERVEERLRQDSAFRAQVESLRPIVTTLQELPADAWPPPATPTVPLTGRRLITRTRLAIAAGAATIAIMAGAVGYQLRGTASSSPAAAGPTVVLNQLNNQTPSALATAVTGAGGRMIVTFRGLPRPQPGHFYELWLMTDQRHLLALASFSVLSTGAAALSIPLPANPHLFTYLDVSLQAEDAGPQHSGHSVLRGRIA